VLEAGGLHLAVIGVTDHPTDYAATDTRPGVAFADLRREVPRWLSEAVRDAGGDAVLVTPHWGPNMAPEPVPHVRSAARAIGRAGATLIAGHSAHVFQAAQGTVVFDLGDFVDDYLVDPVLRNDLGLLFFVTLDRSGPIRAEALPLKLEYCFTRLAEGDDAAWIGRRFRQACAAQGAEVREDRGRLTWDVRP
jgi:Bacterial capsule synthesis protein PGA_cap